jgi:hypothetical protein
VFNEELRLRCDFLRDHAADGEAEDIRGLAKPAIGKSGFRWLRETASALSGGCTCSQEILLDVSLRGQVESFLAGFGWFCQLLLRTASVDITEGRAED